jgi:hypothetical protein
MYSPESEQHPLHVDGSHVEGTTSGVQLTTDRLRTRIAAARSRTISRSCHVCAREGDSAQLNSLKRSSFSSTRKAIDRSR